MLLAIGGRAPARVSLGFVGRFLWRRFSESVLGTDVEKPVELPPVNLELATVPLTADTLDTLVALEAPHLDRKAAGERFSRGDHGMAATAAGRIVSTVWIGGNAWRLRDLGLEIRLRPDEGVLYDAYTEPDVRRMGVMALLVRACVEDAKTRRKRWLLARAVATNTNTMSTLGRAGFREVMAIQGVLVAGVVGFYRIIGHGGAQPSADALMSRLSPLRPGLLLWQVAGRRGIRVLVPRLTRREDGKPA